MNIRVLFNRLLLIMTLICSLLFPANGQDQSGEEKEKSQKADLIITTRLHSTGHFPYTGSYINHHLNADVNIFYERNNTGFFLFKSYDIEDPKSILNYLQPGVFKTFHAGNKVSLRVFGGYLFSQTSGFSDKDSDIWSALNTVWTINKIFKIEHTALTFNLAKSELHRQLANRLVISALLKDFKFDLYLWHNIIFEINNQFASASLAVNLPKIRLSDKIKIQNTFSYQSYITSYRPSYAMRNGFLFTISVPVQLSSSE